MRAIQVVCVCLFANIPFHPNSHGNHIELLPVCAPLLQRLCFPESTPFNCALFTLLWNWPPCAFLALSIHTAQTKPSAVWAAIHGGRFAWRWVYFIGISRFFIHSFHFCVWPPFQTSLLDICIVLMNWLRLLPSLHPVARIPSCLLEALLAAAEAPFSILKLISSSHLIQLNWSVICFYWTQNSAMQLYICSLLTPRFKE